MTRAMMLCAGLGTRLGVLGQALPKPLLPMADIPIVRYGIALLVGHGIRDIVINLHYRPDMFESELGDGSELGARIRYSYESVILGTGGGLKHALPLLDPDGDDEPFVVMNGKLVLDADVTGLLAAHRAAGDAMATLLVQPMPEARPFGAIDVGDDLRVRDMLGEGGYMFCGVHVTRPSVVRELPDGEACSIRQGYLPWLHAGRGTVAAHLHHGYFEEHSTPARYLAGNAAVVAGASLRYPPGALRGVDAAAHVDPSASIDDAVRIAADARIGAGATIGPHTVVGRGAVVEPEARLTRTVVWPGATARGELRDVIVTPDGVVDARETDEPS